MGCVNSEGQFSHWFGNIHLSGPCNRSCYFCIGQHMMALDPLNNLDTWPLENLTGFIESCRDKRIGEVNLTGSNTDPLLYRHHTKLCAELREQIPGVRLGIRTNGIALGRGRLVLGLYDKASISLTSLDPDIYRSTMGEGEPPDVAAFLRLCPEMPVKANIVLCPETVNSGDIFDTLSELSMLGIKTVNLREPYGQPHIGSPLSNPLGERLGMPRYRWNGMDVTYWDVHYVEVESVNLYANGIVSTTYPVTRGHSPNGTVIAQDHWKQSGRQFAQWVKQGL